MNDRKLVLGGLFVVGTMLIGLSGAQAAHELQYVTRWGGDASALAMDAGTLHLCAGQTLTTYDLFYPDWPAPMGTVVLPSRPHEIVADGDHVYVADGNLTVIDVSDPYAPSVATTYSTGMSTENLALQGDYLYLIGQAGEYDLVLKVLDMSTPSSPTLAGELWLNGWGNDVAIAGDFASIADDWNGLRVIDVSDPTTMTETGSVMPNCYPSTVLMEGDYVYVALWGHWCGSPFEIYQLSEAGVPGLVGSVPMGAVDGLPGHIAKDGNLVLLTGEEVGLQVINVADLAAPTPVGRAYDTEYETGTVAAASGLAYFLDGSIALAIADLSDPTDPFVFERIGTGGQTADVAVSTNVKTGEDERISFNYAYLVGGDFDILDLGYDPRYAYRTGGCVTPGHAQAVFATEYFAYVADGYEGVQVIDIGDVILPEIIWSEYTGGEAHDVFVSGDFAYVADDWHGLQIYDLSTPPEMRWVGEYDTPGRAQGVFVSGNLAYVADDWQGLQIVDVSTPSAPVWLGQYDALSVATDVALVEDYALVTNGSYGIAVIDVSNPAAPSWVTDVDTTNALGITVQDNLALVADQWGGAGVIDVTTPTAPTFEDAYALDQAMQVEADSDYVYVAAGYDGLVILEVTDGLSADPYTYDWHITFFPGPPSEAGLEITTYGTVYNDGPGEAECTLSFYQDALPGDGGIHLGSVPDITVPPGEFQTVTVPWDTTWQYGVRDIYVVIEDVPPDSGDDPTNNTAHTTFDVIDTIPPTTTITAGPAQESRINATEVMCEWTGSDAGTPTDSLVFAWCLAESGGDCDPSAETFSGDTSTILAGLTETASPYTFKVVSQDLAGNVDPTAEDRTFTVDVTPPTLTEQTPSGEVHDCVGYIEVVFDESLDRFSTGADDVTLEGPDGPVTITAFHPMDSPTDRTFRIDWAGPLCTEGDYTFSVGPAVTDLAGNELVAAYVGSFTITLPNLVTSEVEVPFEAWTGQSVDVAWTVSNAGTFATTTAWQDCAYLSYDNAVGNDEPLGCWPNPAALDIGEHYDRVGSVVIPGDLVEGDHWIVITADDPDAMQETMEDDNTVIAGPVPIYVAPCADLEPSALVVPEDPVAAGGTGYVDWLVTNIGTGPTDVPLWHERIYLSNDQVLDGSDRRVTPDFENPMVLNAAESYPQQVAFDVPVDLFGEYYVIVVVDYFDALAECREDNNVLASDTRLTVEQRVPPLLSATDCGVTPMAPWPGETITVDWTLTNTGELPTGPFNIDHGVFLSTDDTLDYPGDQLLDWHVGDIADELAAGETSGPISADVELPETIFGDFYVIVWPDPFQSSGLDKVPCAIPITIQAAPPADLEITSFSLPPAADSGQVLDLTWTVRNAAFEPTWVDWWDDRVTLSVDDSLETTEDNTPLGTFRHYGVLEYDEQYTAPASGQMRLPDEADGLYHVFVELDAGQRVYEGPWEGNNTLLAGTVDVTYAPPDLEVTAADVLAEGVPAIQVPSGTRVTIEWDVTNTGTGATSTGSWYDRVYLSDDDVLGPEDQTIANRWHTGALATGETYLASREITIPISFASETTHVFICTDYHQQVYESDNDNNCSATGPFEVVWSPPDLRVQSVEVTWEGESAEAGSLVTVESTVINDDLGDITGGSWYDAILLSTDPVQDAGDRLITQVSQPGPLPAGETYTRTAEIEIPIDFAGPEIYVLALADRWNWVYERDYDNNLGASAPFEVAWGLPDLVVDSVAVSGPVVSGEPLMVDWTVRNSGGPTDTDTWHDSLYLSADHLLSGDDEPLAVGVSHTGNLAFGDTYIGSATVDIPADAVNRMYLIAVADSYDEETEYDEENNTKYLKVWATPLVDLLITEVDAPDTALSGQTLSLSWTVENQGIGNTPTAQWRDVVYLSPDQYLDRSNDIYLGSYERNGGLTPAGTEDDNYTADFAAQIPFGLSGPYYVFVVTDSTNRVSEQNDAGDAEDNNVAYDGAAMQIVIPPPSDLVVTDIVVPAPAAPSEPVTVEWTVRNDGEFEAQGSWHDAVYVSADEVWDIDDRKIGMIQRDGPLAPGAEYTPAAELTAPLPGVVPGDYYIIIRTDLRNEVRESIAGEENNEAVSADRFSVDCWTLLPGVPDDTHTLSPGTEHFFRLADLTPGQAFVVTLDTDDDTAMTELYIRGGALPDAGHYDYAHSELFAADHEVFVPAATVDTYYILVRAGSMAGPSTGYTVEASLLPFEIRSLEPTRGGNTGEVTIRIRGGQLTHDTVVLLVDEGRAAIEGGRPVVVDATDIYVTFDLSGADLGVYDVEIEKPGDEWAVLVDGFEIVTGLGAYVETRLATPPLARLGNEGLFWVEYRNAGDTNADPVLVTISNTFDLPMRLVSWEEANDSALQVLTIHQGAPLATLPPGADGRIPVIFEATTDGMVDFEVANLSASDLPIDWAGLTDALRPPNADPLVWEAVYAELTAHLGSTWADFAAVLVDNAAVRAAIGELTYDARELFGDEVDDYYVEAPHALAGRVFLADNGLPLAETEVTVRRTDGDFAATTETDDNGWVALAFVPPGTYGFEVAGHIESEPTQAVMPPGAKLVEIELPVYLGGSIAGTVTNAAAVSVVAWGADGTTKGTFTEADGTYAIDGLPTGTYSVGALAEDYVAAGTETQIDVMAGEVVSGIDFVLEPAGYIAGTVRVAGSGEALADQMVTARAADETLLSAVTDENGDYLITSVAAGDWEVEVASRFYLSPDPEIVTVTAGATSTLDVDLALGGTVTGLVTDSGGQPMPGVRVRANDFDQAYQVQTWTDESGAYALSPLAPGVYRVTAQEVDQIPAYVDDIEIVGEETITDTDLQLTPGKWFDGSVNWAGTKAPVSGAMIIMTAPDGTPHGVETGPNGSFVLTDLSPGAYHLNVLANGAVTHQQMFEVPDGGEVPTLDIALSPGSMVSGTVTTASRSAMENAIVVLRDADGTRLGHAITDQGGDYLFPVVPPGEYQLEVWSELLGFENSAIVVSEGQSVTHDFVAAGGSLTGTVSALSGGATIAEANVIVVRPGPGGAGARSAALTTDLNGQYALPHLQAGTYWVAVEAEGFGRSGRYLTVGGSGATVADFALDAPAALTGVVIDADSAAPIGGAWLLIRSTAALADDAGTSVEADEAGAFVLPNLSPGTYRLFAHAPGFVCPLIDVTVTAGADPLVVEMSSTGGQLTVNVVDDSTDLPIANSTVLVMQDGWPVGLTVTDATGTARFGPLADGAYRLTVTGRQVRRDQTVAVAGAQTDVAVRVSPPPLPGLPAVAMSSPYAEPYPNCDDQPPGDYPPLPTPPWTMTKFPEMPACAYAVQLIDQRNWLVDTLMAGLDDKLNSLKGMLGVANMWRDELSGDCADVRTNKAWLIKELTNLGIDAVLEILPNKKIQFTLSLGKAVYDWTTTLITVGETGGDIGDITNGFNLMNTLADAQDADIPLLGLVFDSFHTGRALGAYLASVTMFHSHAESWLESRQQYMEEFDRLKSEYDTYVKKREFYELVAGKDCCALCALGYYLPGFDCAEECDPDDPKPEPPPPPGGTGGTLIVGAVDPNEKHGPPAYGEAQWIGVQNDLPFVINFENLPDASAPAQQVVVLDQLSPNLDWRTFQLGEIAIADTVIEVPPRRAYYTGQVTLDTGVLARVQAGLDVHTGLVTWTLTAIDPETGEMPEDPLLGLLPPNDPEVHDGEGHVTFTIRARSNVPTGTALTNQATIIFDVNEPIDTNEVYRTIDAEVPSSVIDPLPAQVEAGEVTLNWSSQDASGGSGLEGVTVYVSVDGGTFAPLVTGSIDSAHTLSVEAGHQYAFYSVARDQAGNSEAVPAAADTATEVLAALAVSETTVNQGLNQRSNLTELTVSFTTASNLDELIGNGTVVDAVTLWRRGTRKLAAATAQPIRSSVGDRELLRRSSSVSITPVPGYADLDATPAPLGADEQVPLDVNRYQWNAESATLTLDLTTDGPGGGTTTLLTDGNYELRLDTTLIRSVLDTELSDTDGTADGVYRIGDLAEDGLFRLAGDATGDRQVDNADLQVIRNAWLAANGAPGFNRNADLNSDGRVNFQDLRLVRANWLNSLGF